MNLQQIKKIFLRTSIGKIIKKYRRKYLEEKQLNRFIKLHGIHDERIKQDVYDSIQKYNITIEEYFLFGFYGLSPEKRKEFVPDEERIPICDSMNQIENRNIFNNKFLTYSKFKKFYKRDVLGIDFQKDDDVDEVLLKYADDFNVFIQKHKEFLLKPINGSLGVGIFLLTVDEGCKGDASKKLLKSLIKKTPGGFVLEEKIQQVPEMAKLHPQSVNTLRITTLRLDDRIEIIHPYLKFGRGNLIVDNGCAGGVIATLDENGKVKATADKNGISHTRFEDMGFDIIGWQVPCWKEAIDFAKQLAMVVPSNRYTGWDIALTADGWCMVEGNCRGQFVGWQRTDHVGFRSELNQLLDELKKS